MAASAAAGGKLRAEAVSASLVSRLPPRFIQPYWQNLVGYRDQTWTLKHHQ